MEIKVIILLLVILVNILFAYYFVRDLLAHKGLTLREAGNNIQMAISQFFIYFLSTLGISDFAIGASLYPKMGWVEARKLPGTLNTACAIPVAVMALAYISTINVELTTLITCIVAQVVGAYVSPRFVVRLPANIIKIFIGIGLIIAALLIIAGMMGLIKGGGHATGLHGATLVGLGVICFILGGLNNLGIGSYALTMVAVYLFGLDPTISFPIMMGAATFSVAVGGIQFVKLDAYSRKITLFSATFGVIGVLIAAFVVKSLPLEKLKWVVVAVILYSAYGMLSSALKKQEG